MIYVYRSPVYCVSLANEPTRSGKRRSYDRACLVIAASSAWSLGLAACSIARVDPTGVYVSDVVYGLRGYQIGCAGRQPSETVWRRCDVRQKYPILVDFNMAEIRIVRVSPAPCYVICAFRCAHQSCYGFWRPCVELDRPCVRAVRIASCVVRIDLVRVVAVNVCLVYRTDN